MIASEGVLRQLSAGTVVTTLSTIGHSTRSAEEFVELLAGSQIARVVDVRQFPGSRRYPHFGSGPLQAALSDAGIAYAHAVDLGGRRRPSANSPNAYWKNASFRAFADHMATPRFLAALDRLVDDAGRSRTAIMCAEAVPWRCHRYLIADALVARGLEVIHIIGPTSSQAHVLNAHAHVSGQGVVTYPPADVAVDDAISLWTDA
jgi:uncharacterized protein (DUF488 family)